MDKTIKLFIFTFLLNSSIVAQKANTFHNRSFWKTNPSIEIIEQNISEGNDITALNSNAFDAVVYALLEKVDNKTVKYFLTNGASINDKDTYGNGLFEYTAKGGNIPLLKILLKKGVKKGENAMIFASEGLRGKKNTLSTYKSLEFLGVNANVVDEKGRNPLHSIANNSNDLAIYKHFISKKVDVNLQDKGGNSPFMNAANSNTLEVVEYLSKYVKNINLKDENGRTALAMTVNRNTIDVVEFLIEKGANINTKDKEGNTLSYYLINNFRGNKTEKFEAKLKLLLEKGLVVNQLQNSRNTLLHIATKRDNLPLLKRLSSFNIDVNTKNKDNLSALQIAVMTAKDDKIIKYLLSIGADKNVKTDFDESVYDLASENELLQKQNINISFLK